ncbi:MAG: CoA transferase [Acidimicrobiales bacterium]
MSPKQWRGLLEATDAVDAVAAIETELGVSFRDEGARFAHREAITAAVAPWIAAHTIDEVAARFDALGVCWGRYQSFKELVDRDPRVSLESDLFRNLEQPGIGTYLTPGSPVAFGGTLPLEPTAAPRLGEHTEQILAETLGLSAGEIGALHDDGVVASPS